MAKALSLALVGKQFDHVYHSGVVCFGKEYFFGGGGMNPSASGVSCTRPQDFEAMFGMRPVEIIDLGRTTRTYEEMLTFLAEAKTRWSCGSYSLLKHNCNHFADELVTFLLRQPGLVPDRILKQPEEFAKTPMGAQFAPMIDAFTASMQETLGGQGIVPLAPTTAPAAGSGAGRVQEKLDAAKKQRARIVQNRASLAAAARPLIYPESSAAVAMGRRLITFSANNAAPDGSALTAGEKRLLMSLCGILVKPLCAKPQESDPTSSSRFLDPHEGGAPQSSSWERLPRGSTRLVCRMVSEWVRPRAQFPALYLLRLLVLREEEDTVAGSIVRASGVPPEAEEHQLQAVLMQTLRGVASRINVLKSDSFSISLAMVAHTALANAFAGVLDGKDLRRPGLRATDDPALVEALLDSYCKHIASESLDGSEEGAKTKMSPCLSLLETSVGSLLNMFLSPSLKLGPDAVIRAILSTSSALERLALLTKDATEGRKKAGKCINAREALLWTLLSACAQGISAAKGSADASELIADVNLWSSLAILAESAPSERTRDLAKAIQDMIPTLNSQG
jgi:hypothetical protein